MGFVHFLTLGSIVAGLLISAVFLEVVLSAQWVPVARTFYYPGSIPGSPAIVLVLKLQQVPCLIFLLSPPAACGTASPPALQPYQNQIRNITVCPPPTVAQCLPRTLEKTPV